MSFNGWIEKKLGEILNFRRGHDLTRKNMKQGNYPVVGSNGIIGYHNEFTTNSPCITIGRSGNVGNPHITYEKAWAHNTTLYIDDYKGNNPEFIYYFLKTLNLGYYAGGSAVPSLNRNHIHPLEVYYPVNILEQRLITNFLLKLDQKIELNNQINETLEEMAQAIFIHWFVDYEFPNENGEPYKSSGGKFVESELGMIPEGWEVKDLGDLITVIDNRGKTPPLSSNQTTYPIIDVRALSGIERIIDYNNCTKYVEKETYENWFRSGHPQSKDILLSTVGSVGELKLFMGDIGCIAQNVVALRSKNISAYYLYQYLKFIKNELISYNIGSVQPSIKITHIIKHNILIPDQEIQMKFTRLIKEITHEIYSNSKQNKTLINLRDTLLPKLMSGEIRIPDAEKEVEACLQKNS